MRPLNSSRGVSLIAAIFIIVILAFMGVMFVSLIGTGSFTSVNDLQSGQALYVAEGGGEYAKNQFENGITCGSLNYNNITLGQGTFTTIGQRYNPVGVNLLTLSATITAAVTTIPVSGDPVAAGYAPQGRTRIEDEEISYGGISGNSFINVKRGVAGTTALAHNVVDGYGVAVSVLQDQCSITSIGTVGNARRTVVVDVPGYASAAVSAYLDAEQIFVNNTMTKIGSLKTQLAAGNNLIVVVVALQNIATNNATTIAAGNLQLRKGAAILASNALAIRVEGTNNPDVDNFPQETQFFLYRDSGAAVYPTYDVVAQASVNNRITAKVKMVVFNNVPNHYFYNEPAVVELGNGAPVVLSSRATGLPAGDNIILAAVQLDNRRNQTRTIVGGTPGALCLRRGGIAGPIVASNRISIGMEANGNANEGTGFLLIARDQGIGANQTYTVTGYASGIDVDGHVKMLVFNGLSSAFQSTGIINPIPNAAITTLGSLATTFLGGDNIVISSQQYYNNAGTDRSILADQLVYSAVTATNITPIYLASGNQVDDYSTGLILHHTGAPANPTYDWQSRANNNNVQADAEMVAIHLNINTILLFGWREDFP